MDNQAKETAEMQRLMSQVFDGSLIVAGLACAVYGLVAQRVPVVLAFVPVGEMTRESQPTAFWGFIVMSVVLALVGGIQLVRSWNRDVSE